MAFLDQQFHPILRSGAGGADGAGESRAGYCSSVVRVTAVLLKQDRGVRSAQFSVHHFYCLFTEGKTIT